MKLSIDARGANLYKGSGIGTYTQNILKNMLKIDFENLYTIFWTGEDYKEYKKQNSSIILTSKKHSMFYENYYYPTYLDKTNIDLHFIPQNGIGLCDAYKTKTIVTIHDLIPYIMPETVGKGYLKRFLKDIPYVMENSSGILTVSEHSKKDIIKFFPNFPEDKIFVTPLAANENYVPIDKNCCKKFLYLKYKIEDNFLLYIGGFSSRKNVKELIIAFKNIQKSLTKNYKLVLCGALKDEGEKLKEFAKEIDILDKVIFTGFVDDSDLPIFYNACTAFVYPTLYEGFGLPPLEAMSCKTPVITSNVSSIPEIANDSALLINPFDTKHLSESMLLLLSSESYNEELSEKGFLNSKNFTWQNTAKLTLDAISNL